MRSAALVVAVILGTGAATAQQLDVEFDPDRYGECQGAQVMGLNPNGDGFLAVRTGPGSNYRKIDELHNGDRVWPCVGNGPWWGIVYGTPRRKGWVHGNWLGNWAG